MNIAWQTTTESISPFLMLGFLSSFNLIYTIDGRIVQRTGNGIRTIFDRRFITRTDGLLLRTIEIAVLFGLPFLTDNFFGNLYANYQHYFLSYLVFLGIWTYLVPIRGQLGGRFSRNEKVGISLSVLVGFLPIIV
ncbi:hypothetical protein [Candidatus Nitrosotalea okcheonensis]|uniref:Uncharacterized protein n=1 Tax=Candidatus Nitrosotalea okcheonensis TaxID=1903276 RepID=A0A2H1FBU5_9ARCH|nr:hypothetical protein [Candidatus Nitrosotalea okcheonensis]MDE2590000.1 hypothetical protein [Patescibacteria group bacterium]SMH70240.1 membrane protein of unknown function [Candidatus Nitrosotalea okcheonensis]